MFSKFFGIFKRKKEVKTMNTPPHTNVDEFINSFQDYELNMLRSELIGCESAAVPDHIDEIISYLRSKCSDDDLKWYTEEIRKEYKK